MEPVSCAGFIDQASVHQVERLRLAGCRLRPDRTELAVEIPQQRAGRRELRPGPRNPGVSSDRARVPYADLVWWPTAIGHPSSPGYPSRNYTGRSLGVFK